MTKNLLTALMFVVSSVMIGCTETATNESATETTTENANTTSTSNSIVYINTDSLVRGYQLFIDLRAKFDDKASKVEKELENKTRSLERKVSDFQNKIQKGLVTRAQAAELEQKLTTEQQEVLQYRDRVLAELQEEEQVMFNNINNEVEMYLKKFNEEKKYDLILSTNAINNTVMIGNPELDITTIVLNGLNSEYKPEVE